jgi:integrase
MGRGPGVRAASESSIQIDFKFAGLRCREKLSLPPTPANLKYAGRLKARIEHEIALGQFDYARHFPTSPRAKLLARERGSVYTVREILGSWLGRVEKELQPETYHDYSEYVRLTWLPKFGALQVSQLSLPMVQDWVADQVVSRKRILNLLTPLRQALRQAVSDGILAVDPLGKLQVKRPDQITEDLIDPFTPAEIAAIVARLEPQTGNAATFWAWTGVREGELLALTWADVDLERSTVRIAKAMRGARTKAPKTRQGLRTVRLLAPALEALKRQQAHTRLMGKQVFLNPSWRPQVGARWAQPKAGPWTEKRMRMAWEAACVAAGVRYRPPKQLRHTFASWTLSAGESPIWVAKMMGHADASITQRVYARFVPEVFADAGARTMAAIKGRSA